MSGMIPGVGVEARRRISCHHPRPNDARLLRLPDCVASRTDFPNSDTTEVAAEARNRLEHKLRHTSSSPSQSFGKCGLKRSGSAGMVRNVIFRRLWRFWSRNHKQQVCAVCLDNFLCENEEIMVLSCSHKYHSKCVLPWLEAHSNCPYCRNPV